ACKHVLATCSLARRRGRLGWVRARVSRSEDVALCLELEEQLGPLRASALLVGHVEEEPDGGPYHRVPRKQRGHVVTSVAEPGPDSADLFPVREQRPQERPAPIVGVDPAPAL